MVMLLLHSNFTKIYLILVNGFYFFGAAFSSSLMLFCCLVETSRLIYKLKNEISTVSPPEADSDIHFG